MRNDSNLVILGDTNAAYKLYFFMKKEVISRKNISIPKIGNLYFHPIVKEEVEAHADAWRVMQEYNYKSPDIPNFFDTIGKESIQDIVKFVKENTKEDIHSVDIYSDNFSKKRKSYEAERGRLQKEWIRQNVKGKKVTSKPSTNDYKLLYSVDTENFKLVTHDEILLSIAREFLNEGQTLKSEDIINHVLLNNPDLSEKVNAAITNLDFMNERIDSARVFRNVHSK